MNEIHEGHHQLLLNASFSFVIPRSHGVSCLGHVRPSQTIPFHVRSDYLMSSRVRSSHVISCRVIPGRSCHFVNPVLLTCLSAKDSRQIRRLSLPIRPIRRWIVRSSPSRNRSFAPSLLCQRDCCRTLGCIWKVF